MKNVGVAQLRRLRLREGDVILVRDLETMEGLLRMRMPEGCKIPRCPVVLAPGSVHRIPREYLERLIEREK